MGWKLRFTPSEPVGVVWQIKELEKPVAQWGPFLAPESAA
jgi:hypothetical protein